MSIGEVARRAGLRPSAIRYYEDADLLPTPARVGGRRRYDTSVLERLSILRLAQRSGFSISELRALMRDGEARGLAEARRMVEKKLVDIEARIREAEEMRTLLQRWLECTCQEASACELVAENAGPAPALRQRDVQPAGRGQPRRRLAVMG
jgi:DNA-binding transcriptional MerR regulator